MTEQKIVEIVPIPLPPQEQRVNRGAEIAAEGEKKTRYSLPVSLETGSPVGYRTRLNLTQPEAKSLMPLLSLDWPSAFEAHDPVTEAELFEEASLGVLSARQSTNYRGHRQVTVGPKDSKRVAELLADMSGKEPGSHVLEKAAYTHIVLSRPYRTPFTFLLTFIGHKPLLSLGTVMARALRKKFQHMDDIPTIGLMQQLHIGILADAQERAAVIASNGKRRANVFQGPCLGKAAAANKGALSELEKMIGLTQSERAMGWRIAIISQVGQIPKSERLDVEKSTYRKLGANLLALRSERIQPGVNQEEKAPDSYQHRQDMDVPDELTVMAGRAAYNAFCHWTGCERERSKEYLLIERVDVLTPNGKERLREIRRMLGDITELIISGIPLWADLPTGKALSRNAARGKKAFALAGQRIYIGGLDRDEVERDGMEWDLAVRAFGAAASRSGLVAELMGCVDLPAECDLLAGICLMAGPVNQNDIGKEFYGYRDILAKHFPDKNPTSLLVWTLKAKTVADPIGNEEQLMNAARKGALVDLRPAVHDVVAIRQENRVEPMRRREGRTNTERAFFDQGNFVTSPEGREISGNRGSAWPDGWRNEVIW